MFKWKCIGHDQKLCITQLWTHFRKTYLRTSLFVMQDIYTCKITTKTRCRKWGDWWNLLYFTWNRNQFKRSVLNEQMQLICVILSLYKAPLRLIGRCFYCMDCSCLFTFWRWSVLIYYIHISVKFLNGVFSQQQQKKNNSPMFLYLIY